MVHQLVERTESDTPREEEATHRLATRLFDVKEEEEEGLLHRSVYIFFPEELREELLILEAAATGGDSS